MSENQSPKVQWERMFPDELEAAFAACPLVWFSYGLCEPHGPHNAVGLDALKAHGLCCRAALAAWGIVAPADYWHIHEIGTYAAWAARSVGEVKRSWLTCMPPWQHFKNICYQIRQADILGFKAAILLTGHYGPNWVDLKTLIELIQPHIAVRLCGIPDFEANNPGFDNDNKSSGDHAGKVETSLLWALEPACVDVSRLPRAGEAGPHFAMGATAPLSNRKVGERMVEDEVKWLGAKAKELLAEYERVKPTVRLTRFEQVEEFWEGVVKPRLKDFKTMQQTRPNEDPPGEGSVWRVNWRIPSSQ